MRRFNVIILTLILICYAFDFYSVDDINDKHEGYVIRSQFYGCWDGEDEDGHFTGGEMSKVDVIYLDKHYMLRYDKFVTIQEGSVGSKISFEDCGNSLNLYIGLLLIILFIVNYVFVSTERKILQEN